MQQCTQYCIAFLALANLQGSGSGNDNSNGNDNIGIHNGLNNTGEQKDKTSCWKASLGVFAYILK